MILCSFVWMDFCWKNFISAYLQGVSKHWLPLNKQHSWFRYPFPMAWFILNRWSFYRWWTIIQTVLCYSSIVTSRQMILFITFTFDGRWRLIGSYRWWYITQIVLCDNTITKVWQIGRKYCSKVICNYFNNPNLYVQSWRKWAMRCTGTLNDYRSTC